MKKRATACLGGFTLIELLVVVLIIGILAAVALPQYQRAVEKARLVEAWAGLKAIVAAQELYKLENGDYTLDFTNLDLDFPGATYGIGEDIENSKMYLPNGTVYILDQDGYWSGQIPTVPVFLEYWWREKLPYRCRLYGPAVSDQHAHALCKSLGGVLVREDAYGVWYKLS